MGKMHLLVTSVLVAIVSAENLLFVPRSLRAVVCPDKKHECPTANTCCMLPDQTFGCCPVPNAVCCPDKKHCCPSGSQCSTTRVGYCTKRGQEFVAAQKTSAKLINSDLTQIKDNNVVQYEKVEVSKGSSVICPDGRSECMDGQTCCPAKGDTYGCCPIADANCCSDMVHCCPPGFTCNILKQQCTNKRGVTIKWINTRPPHQRSEVSPIPIQQSNVVCPDGQSECKTGQTCCKLASGRYGCCPIPKAVCCNDGKHCCPEGTTCDVSSGKCMRGDLSVVDWFEKVSAADITCPDGTSMCKSGQTCCKLASGRYGCCPIPKAVCCNDGKHCCPEGTTCDVSSGKCMRGDLSVVDWFEKVSAADITCPDGTSMCKSGQTCCKLASGRYGCCPIPKAVCCNDGKHCCPEGTTCDVSSGKCMRGDLSVVDWFEKVSTSEITSMESNVRKNVCPDEKSSCQDKQTCCKQSDTRYACCPIEGAVCCSDNLHCCPKDTKCNLEKMSCDNPIFNTKVPLLKKLPAGKVNTVKCPDGETECPDGNSCCKTSSNGYSCCPYPNGVCCTNSKYCCPHRYVCDEEPGICRIPFTYGLVNMLKDMRGKPLQ